MATLALFIGILLWYWVGFKASVNALAYLEEKYPGCQDREGRAYHFMLYGMALTGPFNWIGPLVVRR